MSDLRRLENYAMPIVTIITNTSETLLYLNRFIQGNGATPDARVNAYRVASTTLADAVKMIEEIPDHREYPELQKVRLSLRKYSTFLPDAPEAWRSEGVYFAELQERAIRFWDSHRDGLLDTGEELSMFFDDIVAAVESACVVDDDGTMAKSELVAEMTSSITGLPRTAAYSRIATAEKNGDLVPAGNGHFTLESARSFLEGQKPKRDWERKSTDPFEID